MLVVKTAIRDRIIQVANNVSNYRLANIDFEINSLLTFLTELSYHEDVSDCIGLCTNALELLKSSMPDDCLQKKGRPDLVCVSSSGRGRPYYCIAEETLIFFMENGFTIKQMASMLVVSEKTVVNRMKEYGLSIRQTYSDISDEDLIPIVKQKVTEFPSVGYRSIRGHLMTEGIKVTETRIRRIMRAVDPLGVLLRNALCRTYRIRRRTYSVRAPRALWHVDSNHKLIRIERFWRELWDGCTKTYYELFGRMEQEGLLNIENEVHLLVLHIVYLNRIQRSIDLFINAVSRRPLRTERNRTPMQLWIMGQMEDRQDQLSTEDLAFYGVDFDCQEPVRDDTDIVVHPLLQLDQEPLSEINRIAKQHVETPFEVQTYIDICTYLAANGGLPIA